ncbi:hypothetical protein GCM10027037_23420 [Mucilaginibacter koreensis]
MLEEEHFVVATLSQDEFSAIAADELIAEKLRLNTGAPILFKKRYVFDLGEPPIEYNLGYYKASRFVYTIQSTR